MVSPYSRFVVHYRNGDTKVEDKNDPYSWDKLPNKDEFIAVGIKMDPLLLHDVKKRVGRPQHMLYSSRNKRYFFFQTKDISRLNPNPAHPLAIKREGGKGWFNCHRVGMVFTKEGDCQVIDVDQIGNSRCYVTTLDSILPHANLELFGIELDRVGESIEN